MKKRIFSALVALSLVFSLAGTALAEGTDTGDVSTVTVSQTEDTTIPDNPSGGESTPQTQQAPTTEPQSASETETTADEEPESSEITEEAQDPAGEPQSKEEPTIEETTADEQTVSDSETSSDILDQLDASSTAASQETVPVVVNNLEEVTAQPQSTINGEEQQEVTYSFTIDENEKTVAIATADQLREWAASITTDKKSYDGYTIDITGDIDLSGKNWTSIISLGGNVTIDGHNHTISNMVISEKGNGNNNNTYLGFIGDLNYNTKLTIQNITFTNAYVQDPDGDKEYSWCGVVVGHGPMDGVGETQAECVFKNVRVENSVVTGGHNNGGIMGYSCSTETGILFDGCVVSNSFIGGYNSTSGILFGMGIANVKVQNCSANGVRLYSDGLNFKCTQSSVKTDNSLWLGNVYPAEIYGDRYGSNGKAVYGDNNRLNNCCVVYPVIFHVGDKSVQEYIPVNTPLSDFDDVLFGDIFETASGKTIRWYNGDGLNDEEVEMIVANTTDADMYPYGTDATENKQAYETQDTSGVANPLTHGAIELYARSTSGTPGGDEEVEIDWDTSKSKTATNLDENFQSEVTLSLPSAQETLETDVVFVLDKSTSASVEDSALEMLKDLQGQIEKTNAKVNVGVVIFNSVANVFNNGGFFDLATQYDDIEAAFKTDIKSGTNIHAGLLAAKEMLDNDTDVDNSRKYMILVSDGQSYYYCKDGNYSTAYTISSRNGGDTGTGGKNEAPNSGLSAWECKYASDYVPENWNEYFDEVEAVLNNDYSAYEYTLGDPDIPNVSDADAQGSIPYADRNKYPINVDLSLYYSNQVYQELSQKYHCFAMQGETGSVTYPFGVSFMKYLANGKEVTFDEIQNDIYYLLDAGSTVVDVIGYGDDYNFDFVNDSSALTLTVNGTKLPVTKLGEDSYGFGQADGSSDGTTYPYVLTYYPNGYADGNEAEKANECFVWQINVPVTNFEPVQLTYKVTLTNPQTAAGEYGIYDADGSEGRDSLLTNLVATLYPVDTDGYRGEPEEFRRPTVSYTVDAPEQPATPDPGDTTTPDPEQPATPAPGVTTTPAPVDKDEHPEIAQAIQDGTWGATPTPTAAPANHVPQTSDDFPYALCIVLVLVAAGGLGAVVYGKKHNLF